MAKDRKPSRSEVMSMRLDPKSRFQLDFIARAKGQNLTTVIERAIADAADHVEVRDETVQGVHRLEWRAIWNVSEGARSLNLWRHKTLFPSYEEEYKLAFAEEHWPFFYYTKHGHDPKVWSIDVLWPRIDEFVAIWREKRSEDFYAAGKAMQEALRKAGLTPPEWPSPDNDPATDLPF